MTLERCNERCKQSMRTSDYVLKNPSNNTNKLQNCVVSPGLMCNRSLHTKQSNTIDTETVLLRGVKSVGVENSPSPSHVTAFETNANNNMDTSVLLGESTRVGKSCNSERELNRFENQSTLYPMVSNKTLFGINARDVAKYGN